jgi:PAS domain S-box-containing protein
VFLYDRDLIVTEFNARFVEILQSTPDKLRGLRMRMLRDRRIIPVLERAIEGEAAQYEGPYQATTSEARLHIALRVAPLRDATGQVVGALGLAEDITARSRAQSALQTSEQRLALHVRRSPLAVVGFDTTGAVVEWNPAAERTFGWSENEAMGKNGLELLVPAHAREAITDVFRALLARRGGERSVNENVTKDRRIILCDWYNTALVDDAGRVIGVASMVEDITDRQHAEGALRRSEARFRTLIENAPDAICVYPPDDRRIVYANSGLASLLGYDDLRTFTRAADEEKRAAVDVRRVLDASINLAWNEIRHRARLVKEYDDVPPIVANEARLRQVFLNLLVNTAQALQVGAASENVIRVATSTNRAGHVVVEVSGTGPGIADEILDRFFDPFFTTKPVGVGSGLGLWICQGIVTSLGGHITADSKPGCGATFRVLLPSATTVEQLSSQPPRIAPAPPAEKRLRLLVVDDEIAIGRTLAIALSDAFEVTTATRGREALALLEGGNRAFDVILCDLMMPDVSGMDVYERVVVHVPAMARRFVFVTGGAFTDRARAFVECVQTPVIEKPFDLATLPNLLRSQAALAP